MAMGGQFSKTRSGRGEGSRSSGSGSGSRSSNRPIRFSSVPLPEINRDLSSYEAACRRDPDLRSFDSSLQQRTSRLITSLADGVDGRSLSLDVLRNLLEFCLVEVNHEVVDFILQCKEDIWRNRELSDLVDDYFKNSFLNLELCAALDRSLKRSRDGLLVVKAALQSFEQDGSNQTDQGYGKTLGQLREFEAIGDPFTEEFLLLFQSVYEHQKSMLNKLDERKKKLDKKLESVKTWRMLSNVIFGATFASVLVCSVVVAAIAAPAVVAALVGVAASAPLGSMGSWINSLWKKHAKELEGQRKINLLMRTYTDFTIKDLESIQVRVDRLKIDIEAILHNAEFALAEEEGVILAMTEIKKNLNQFMQSIDELTERSHTFSLYVREASLVILKKVIEHPSTG
ncbi:UPF0496 protein 1-like [Diospyros lotus]|uniref:UPF0496 protein 1-like n=1 Tax=Diospyros lotus TaxID=55363 RepID=UPI002255BAAF|nr:UPF0496 protein 1-like [Diospyros lotus]